MPATVNDIIYMYAAKAIGYLYLTNNISNVYTANDSVCLQL